MRCLNWAVPLLRQLSQEAQLPEAGSSSQRCKVGQHCCGEANDCMPGVEVLLSIQYLSA